VALLGDVLQASGGLDLWRQMRRFTVHLSISGALCAHKCGATQLKDLVAEGSTQQQSLEITSFTASDRRALYRPDWVALEGPDGRLLQERRATPAAFRDHMKSTHWDAHLDDRWFSFDMRVCLPMLPILTEPLHNRYISREKLRE
jgi:hypothetical protein